MRPIEVLLIGAMGFLAACSSNSTTEASLSCAACDVTGTWFGEYSVSSNMNAFQVEVVQTGSELTGTMTSSLFSSSSPPAITGTQKDGRIEFGDIAGQIHFTGTTDGNRARGTYDYPTERYTGTWDAARIRTGTIAKVNCIRLEPSGAAPAALTHDGTALWYLSLGDNVIRRIDPAGVVLTSFPRPGNVAGGDPKFAFDGTNLWMSDISSVSVISSQGKLVSNVDITFGPDSSPANGIVAMGGAVWTTGPDSRLRRINDQAKTLETKRMPVNSPGAAAYDGTSLWIAEGFTGTDNVTHLFQLDANLSVTAMYMLTATGSRVQMSDLAYDGANVWASFQDTDEICMLQLTTD